MNRDIKVFANDAADQPLKLAQYKRRSVGETDVAIKISHCGVCHSDLHTARNEWTGTQYPCSPGHEIIGKVRCSIVASRLRL